MKKFNVSLTPKKGAIYAFTKYRKGDFLLFIDSEDGIVYDFMQIPSKFLFSFTREEFEDCLKTKLLEFVECLPEDVFKVCFDNLQK